MSRIVFFLILFPMVASAFDVTGLEIYLSGDMVYTQSLNDESAADEKLTMRGAELSFFAPIDHRFDGVLSLAAHDENGETVAELHELHLSSTKLIPRSRIKVGQFFLGIGRLNRFHQHDWPFIRAPKVHETFFDTEGVFDTGVEYGYLLPTEHFFDLTVGLTSGYRYGHSHTLGSKPKVPTHYTRLATFFDLGSTDGIEMALNYIGRTDEQKNKVIMPGFELTAKWRQGKRIVYQLQAETWYRNQENSLGVHNEQVGLYLYQQYGLTVNTYAGFRLDGYKELSKTNSLTNKRINHIEYGIVPELTWKSSEFATFRFGFSHRFTREEGMTTAKDTRLQAQVVFILGAHPAHSF